MLQNWIYSLQRRSFKLIYGQHPIMNTYAMITPLSHYPTVENFYVNVFYTIKNSESYLNYLLPKSRNSATVQGLRNPFYLVPDKSRTTLHKHSFVVHALNNYQ